MKSSKRIADAEHLAPRWASWDAAQVQGLEQRAPLGRALRQRLESGEVQRVAQSLLGASFTCDAGVWVPTDKVDPAASRQHAVMVGMRLGVDPVQPLAWLQVDAALVAAVVDRALGGTREVTFSVAGALLSDVELGIFLYVLGRLMTAAELSSRCALVEVQQVFPQLSYPPQPSQPPQSPLVNLQAQVAPDGVHDGWVYSTMLHLGGDHGLVRWWVPSQCAVDVPHEETVARLQPVDDSIAHAPVIVRIEGCRFALRAGELSALRVGDVVVPHAPMQCYVAVPATSARRSTVWRCVPLQSPKGDEWMVEEQLEHNEVEAIEFALCREDTAPLAAVQDAPVLVTLELARCTVALRQVLQLAPGAVVRLPVQACTPAALRVGDQVVARGEVVQVDGEFGFRVTQLRERGATSGSAGETAEQCATEP
jgi:flagellar motor switch protein FliN/FliY